MWFDTRAGVLRRLLPTDGVREYRNGAWQVLRINWYFSLENESTISRVPRLYEGNVKKKKFCKGDSGDESCAADTTVSICLCPCNSSPLGLTKRCSPSRTQRRFLTDRHMWRQISKQVRVAKVTDSAAEGTAGGIAYRTPLQPLSKQTVCLS